jgi:NADPH:quinone reductase-like Zn-dependent oxidoreductase
MQAVVYDRYGTPEVLRLAEVPVPVAGDGEVLVRVCAVSVNLSDWETLTGRPAYARLAGLFRPRKHILGSDIAGQVAAVGAGVTRFEVGDEVFGDILDHKGGFAEFVCAPERSLAAIPPGLSYDEASALPQAAAIAWHGIRRVGKVGPGQRVLINGAGGGAGTYAVQLAKLDGAEVTGVDNVGKLDFVRSVGADHVIDSEREDWTRTAASREGYDFVLDLAAYRSVFAYRRALNPGGRYLCVGGSVRTILPVALLGTVLGRVGSRGHRKRIGVLAARSGVEHVGPIVDLCRAGTITTHIDRRFTLAEVPDALRYVGERRARGKVVVVVGAPAS